MNYTNWEKEFNKEFKGSVALIDEMGGTIDIDDLKDFMRDFLSNNK